MSGLSQLASWFNEHRAVATLTLLMGIDVCMGLLVAFNSKTLNSSISRVGMTRKAGKMLLVGAGYAITPYAHGTPVGDVAAIGFLLTEIISISESAVQLGIKVPSALKDALSKPRGGKAPPITVRLESDYPLAPSGKNDKVD